MRSCCSPSSLCGISRAAWRHAVSGTLSLSGSYHHQRNLRYLPLRPPVPPIALGLAERLFSSSSKRSTKKSAAKKGTPMDTAGGDPFYVVRKGDVIGIYNNFADCQAQVSNSVCDPSVTVYKGYSLRKETEEYLAARGLKNAMFSINAADARDDLFDDLAPCPFQQPDGNVTSTLKRPQETETGPSKKHSKFAEQEPLPDSHLSCILEFDGACKGNPGKSGAGVVVRRPDGSVRLRDPVRERANKVFGKRSARLLASSSRLVYPPSQVVLRFAVFVVACFDHSSTQLQQRLLHLQPIGPRYLAC